MDYQPPLGLWPLSPVTIYGNYSLPESLIFSLQPQVDVFPSNAHEEAQFLN